MSTITDLVMVRGAASEDLEGGEEWGKSGQGEVEGREDGG